MKSRRAPYTGGLNCIEQKGQTGISEHVGEKGEVKREGMGVVKGSVLADESRAKSSRL